jgi:outer membrane protein
MPNLSINYGLGSFYSSNRREVAGYQLGSNGLPEIVYGNRVPVFDQLETFFSQQLSFNLSIPIFSRYTPRQGYLNAKLNYDNAILNGKQEEQNLFKAVAQAYQDAKAALAKYKATVVQVENLKASFSYAQARMDAGLLDVYAFIEILNNKSRAETELLQARYDYVLKVKVLDLYQGKPLSF